MRILWCESRGTNNPSPLQLINKLSAKLKDDFTLVWNDKPIDVYNMQSNHDVIVFCYSKKDIEEYWLNLEKCSIPKVMICSDPQVEMPQHVEVAKQLNLSMLLLICPSWITEYKKHTNIKMCALPWWLDDNKQDVEKDIELTYATEHYDYYPIENAMHKDSRINNLKVTKATVGFPRLGQKEYMNVLSRSKILVFDGSKFNIPVLKYIEGMAHECCILAPQTDIALHLREYENFVPITINNYYDKILEYLDDYDAAKRIASNGRMTYLKYHTTEIRMSELLQNLETLINGR
jgi:glycosyltransferase involved in cell wall biosynthesis